MEPKPLKTKHVAVGLLVFVLWLATIVIAIVEVYFVQSIVVNIYARFGDDFGTGVVLRNFTAVIAGIICMIVVVATGEYHLRHAGQPSSARLFAWTIGAELAIYLLYLIV
jgi:hypothetical protein